jgi:hypothetical protein
MIKFEWMMSYAICDGMFDNAFLAFEDAKVVKENSETIVIVATKPAAFLDVSPKYIYGLDIPESLNRRLKRIIVTTIKVFAEENGINLGEQCLGSAVYNRNGDRIACEKSLEYLFPKSMKRERELKNKIRAVLEGGNE